MWIDVSGCALGDAGVAARGLAACETLVHLNLNGNPAGDRGAAALAAALTPKRLSEGVQVVASGPLRSGGAQERRDLDQPRQGPLARRRARCWRRRAWRRRDPLGHHVVPTLTPPNMRWLYLVLDSLGSAGKSLRSHACCSSLVPLECLWCCGAFSAEPPAGSDRGLSRSCGLARYSSPGLTLELEHGLPWGLGVQSTDSETCPCQRYKRTSNQLPGMRLWVGTRAGRHYA